MSAQACEPVLDSYQILTDMYNWDITKNWLHFGVPDLPFKVTKTKNSRLGDIWFLRKHRYQFDLDMGSFEPVSVDYSTRSAGKWG